MHGTQPLPQTQEGEEPGLPSASEEAPGEDAATQGARPPPEETSPQELAAPSEPASLEVPSPEAEAALAESPCPASVTGGTDEDLPGVVPASLELSPSLQSVRHSAAATPDVRAVATPDVRLIGPTLLGASPGTIRSTPKTGSRSFEAPIASPIAPIASPIQEPPLRNAGTGPAVASLGTAPAVPAVTSPPADSLEHLLRTGRHMDEQRSGDEGTDVTPGEACCRLCFVLPCVICLIPIMLITCFFALCLTPAAAYLFLNSDGEEDEAELRRRSSHAPGFMRPVHARAHASATTGLPASLQGVFYLRGHPWDEVLLCFERGALDIARSRLTLPWRVPGARVYKDTVVARFALAVRWLTGLSTVVQFRDAEAVGQPDEVMVHLKVWGLAIPKTLLSHAMRDVSREKDGSLWKIQRAVLGHRLAPYWAERVVDARNADTAYLWNVWREVPCTCLFL